MTKLVSTTYSENLDCRRLNVIFDLKEKDSNGNDAFTIFDESFNINVMIKKDHAVQISTQAIIEITNIDRELRNKLLAAFSLYKERTLQAPFVPVSVEIGRKSSQHLRRVFIGAVVTVDASMPPDIGVRFTCAESQNDRTIQIGTGPGTDIPQTGSFQDLCQYCADQLGLELVYHEELVAQNIQVPSYNVPYALSSLVPMLMSYNSFKIAAYIDDIYLIIRPFANAVNGPIYDINAETGMIGIPSFTESGVSFKCLADIPIPIAGGVRVTSIRNPGLDTTYITSGVVYRLESRGNEWSSEWKAYPSVLTVD